jgi:hypothetical protein
MADLEAGAEFTDVPNDPNGSNEASPYVQAGLNYAYLPGSYFSLGFRHQRASTAQLTGNSGHLITDSQSSVLFTKISRTFMPRLYGSLAFTFQHSDYNNSGTLINSGVPFNTTKNESQNFYTLNTQVEYRFNPFLSGHVGYSYDRMDSDAGDFDRNRVYIGATASY